MAGPAKLVAPDRLEIFGYRLRDTNLVRDKPRLIHTTWDCVPLDLEEGNSERVKDIGTRDVQDDGPAPATADIRGAGAVPHRDLEHADHFGAACIYETPTPLESDDVDVER